MSRPNPMPPARPPARSGGSPGRPKDPGKRAAILETAARLFVAHGFTGVSMDQIAAEAGVSKLTVYSHFGDKETLFAAAVRAHCEQAVPSSLFDGGDPGMPLRERLMAIGRAFFAMIMTPEVIASHRILCSPQLANTSLCEVFWKAGPMRMQQALVELLERRIAAGELDVPDPARAASQFYTLLKGEPHSQAVFGFSCSGMTQCAEEHVASVVDVFLRAYARR